MNLRDQRVKNNSAIMAVLAGLFLIGLAVFAYFPGKGTEAERWGIFTINLLFLMGVTQAGIAFAAIMRLANAQWAKVLYRLGEATTLAFMPFAIAGFLLIYGFGKEHLFYWLSSSDPHHPWLSAPWLLIRNLTALLIFYALSTVYFWLALRPDLRNQKYLYYLSSIILIAFVITNTLIAWDFAMMIIPHWHSTVMPIFYWVENLFAGIALLVILSVTLYVIDKPAIDKPAVPLRNMGIMLTGFTLLWLYMFWSQFFVIWFGDLPHETLPLWRQMYGHYSPLFWVMISCAFFIPFGTLIFAKSKTSLPVMVTVALIINAGIWLNKYLLLMPVLSDRHWPFTSLMEFPLIVSLASGFLFVLLLILRRLPMLTQREMDESS
jgi:molybdopterin-containing oxidoreductase family membrane subunit